MGVSITDSPDPHSDKRLTPDRLLFDFNKFLEGGALDDVPEISAGSTYTSTRNSTSEDVKWEVTKLSGGLINVVVRATPRRGDDKLVRNPRSVVIKYAPPFMAAIGKGVPFGTFRQVIEYRALSLLGSTPSVASAEAAYRVAIPRVLKFFEDERVLVLQDLGEWMRPLDVWMYPSSMESSPSLETCSSVGTRLGNVLASIHCDATLLLKSQTLTDDGKAWCENPAAKDFIRDQIVKKVLPILQPWVDPGQGRAEKIAGIISQDFDLGFLETLHPSSSPSPGVPQLMFSMGDLWTGSIIVGVSPTISRFNPRFDATKVEIGLVDWEFASPARIGQDIAQLSAGLYLFSTASAWSSTKPRFRSAGGVKPATGKPLGWRSAAGTFMDALLEAYGRKVKEHPDYVWFIDEEHNQRRFKKERLAVIRSIWILFGMEVVNNSVQAVDKFVGFFTMDVGRGGGEEIKMWQKEMIEVGCWYVLVAGESSDDEFEEVVRRECVLGRMYTVSGSL